MNSKRTVDGNGEGGCGSNLNFDERGTLEGVVQMKYGRLHHISGKFRLRYAVLNMMDGSFAFYSIDHHANNGGGANLTRNLVLLLPHGSWSMYGGPCDDDVGVSDGDHEGDGDAAAAPYLEIVYSNCFQKRRRRRRGRGRSGDNGEGSAAAAAFPTNVSPDRRDFGRRYRRGFRRISLRCASAAERGSWIDAAERVHARGGSGIVVCGGGGGGCSGVAGGAAVVAAAAAADDDPNAMPRRSGVRKVHGLRLRRLKSRRSRTAAAQQHRVGGVVERPAERGRHSSSRKMEASASHRRHDIDIDDAEEESNSNYRSSYSVFDGDDGDDMDEEDDADKAENADFFDQFGMDDHPYGIIAPQHRFESTNSNSNSESDDDDYEEDPGVAFIAPLPKIFRASSEPPIGTPFQSSLNNASSEPPGNDDDGTTAGVQSCRSSPGALYRGGSPRKAKKMQRYKKVKPQRAYAATWMMEEEIVTEMMKPSDSYEDLCRYDYSSLQRISSGGGESRPSQIGRLQVEVLSCIGLPKFDRFSKTDTIVYLLCGESAFATDVIPSCLCPMWPCRSRRAVSIPLFHAYARLFVGVFGVNSNEKENDHFVGRAVVDLATLRPGSEYDATLCLGLSSYAYDRRPRGAVRLRFHLDWSDERAAVLSYLRRCPAVDGKGGVAGVTIPCSDAKTFRNVAITLHGNNLPGKFSRRNFRATRREFVLYHIQTSALVKRIIRNIISWKDPRVSAYVFLGWMHCVYSSSIAMALSYLLGFLIILFVKNYLRYNVDGEACAHGYAPLTFTELFLSLLLGGSGSNRHFMKPASMTSDRTTTTTSERTFSDGSETQDDEKLFIDPNSLDHMEFPFSERNLYPKRSVKESLVPRVRSNSSEKLSSGQMRLLSATASSQLQSPLFDRNDSDLSDADELSDGEDDSVVSDLQPEDPEDEEEMIDDVSPLQTSTNLGTLIPAGPNQNVDILPKKKVPPKVHLLKFENWIHKATGRMFDEKVTCSMLSSRARDNSSANATQVDDDSPEQSDDKDVALVPANTPMNVTLLGSGYLGHVLQAAPILVREAARYLPTQAPILTSSLSSWMFNPTLRLYEDQKCRMISHPSKNSTAQPGNACPDGSVSGKKSKRSIDEFDRRLGLRRQRPNPVAALSADYLGPIMRIMQIYSCAVRIVFNALAWKDPFLSFWVLILLIAATTLSIIFPWRNFFFVVGLVGLGPQNLILTVSKKKIEQEVTQQSTMMSSSNGVNDRRSDSDVGGATGRVGMKVSEPGQSRDDAHASKKTSTFSRFARRRPSMLRRNRSETPSGNTNKGASGASKLPPPFSSRPVKSAPKKSKKQASPREVIVPYTPLRKERFYYWPPDPSASGITLMTSSTSNCVN